MSNNSTLGLEGGIDGYDTPRFTLKLVRASQTVAALETKGAETFDFTPGDWLERRNRDGFFHLGDLNIRYRRAGAEEWFAASTAANRKPVLPIQTPSPATLAAADLAPTLPGDLPVNIKRLWEVRNGALELRFTLTNTSADVVEIGALGIPMVFNNILHERSLEEAHARNVFYDPYIGLDAGYLQVTRLNGHGPALVVVPTESSSFEAYRPLLSDSTQRGITFEGFYEWMIHSYAYADGRPDAEWKSAQPWNQPTSVALAPGTSRSFGVRFLLSNEIRNIENTLMEYGRPVAVGIPGYIVPMDLDAQLFVSARSPIVSIQVEPAGALSVSQDTHFVNLGSQNAPGDTSTSAGKRSGMNQASYVKFSVRGKEWGRARMTIEYADGLRQSIHYKVIKSQQEVLKDVGAFLFNEQWFEQPDDAFGRSPSVISYDYYNKRQVTQDNRAWIAGLGDEGGSGAWLTAFMKQLAIPDSSEIRKLERFVDEVLWGRLQYAEGDLKYGVRKSIFYFEPDEMPEGTYSDSIDYDVWSSWNKEHAMTVGRSFNYPHVAAAYWVMYRLARNNAGLVINHTWDWYLRQAFETTQAMVKFAPEHAQFGQMEGTVFLRILEDLQREAFANEAKDLEIAMRTRADVWRSLAFPFGSEMPWDSTGQEEVYTWCRYFGFDEKALVTLNAILGYMPTVPHWGYNGSARRYWDFLYAGHPTYSRLERQLHHYGSGINAIPVLSEFRLNPDDLYLLRVGYGGLMGAIANITEDGFGPSGFHAYPSTLDIDRYSGDYGPNFFGHVMNVGTYVTEHRDFGWLAFGGAIEVTDELVTVHPRDAFRARLYLAPLGIWLTLDAGKFQSISLRPSTGELVVTFEPATPTTPVARLRIERPGFRGGEAMYSPVESVLSARGAYTVPLSNDTKTTVTLRRQ